MIRMAKPEEAGILAEIEGICFPPLEAASPEQVAERMKAFPENGGRGRWKACRFH